VRLLMDEFMRVGHDVTDGSRGMRPCSCPLVALRAVDTACPGAPDKLLLEAQHWFIRTGGRSRCSARPPPRIHPSGAWVLIEGADVVKTGDGAQPLDDGFEDGHLFDLSNLLESTLACFSKLYG